MVFGSKFGEYSLKKLGGTVGIYIDIVGKLLKKWLILALKPPPKNLGNFGGLLCDL